jgi:integration host factor subunit beta
VGVHAARKILKEKKSMKKSDLIEALAVKEDLLDKEAFDIVNLIFSGFTDALRKGGRIEIRGFGSFTVRSYPSYLGKNPKTGQRVKVSPKKLPYFKVGKELKEGVNKGKKKRG